jgi:hypothetical protein
MCGVGISQASKRASAISFHSAIDTRPRTEQDGSDLSRRITGSAQQDDMQGEPVAVASAAQFKEQLFLL